MKPKHGLMCMILAFALWGIVVISCMRPPSDTTTIELNGKPALAWDRDHDGMADLDAEGEPMVVAGSPAAYSAADTVDSIAPGVLETLAAFGIPGAGILVGIASAWRAHKFGRVVANTVMSIQTGRERLAVNGKGEALEILDDALRTQTPETVKMVRDIKERLGIGSVPKPSGTKA